MLDTENLATQSFPQAPQLLLVLSGCNSESDSPGLFDPAEPTGEYKLDMSLPYSRMVLSELLALSEEKKGYEVWWASSMVVTIPLRVDIDNA